VCSHRESYMNLISYDLLGVHVPKASVLVC